jgi:hypothetical protein
MLKIRCKRKEDKNEGAEIRTQLQGSIEGPDARRTMHEALHIRGDFLLQVGVSKRLDLDTFPQKYGAKGAKITYRSRSEGKI